MFLDPKGAAAEMIIPLKADEERRMRAYQHLTALARLVWDRPYDPKLPQRLQRVTCPVLLLWGAQDKLVPPSYGEAYKKHLPQAEMQLIAACGHLGMFEKEEQFVAAVRRFAQAEVPA